MIYLITGAAGFIGFSLSKKLLEKGEQIVGVDNLNNYYYSQQLKKDRLKILLRYPNFSFHKIDICDSPKLEKVFSKYKPRRVCNLAAQAGVRYSLENPFAYEKSNMLGFLNILELMRKFKIKNLVFASSSSVYGGIDKTPFKENMQINKPISIYAATKAANEIYSYVYHHLFGINCIGLRFFSVYGPWGRPDMALFLFTKSISEGKKISVFNSGKMSRDFTYIDDIVNGIEKSLEKVEKIGYEIINLGQSKPINLNKFISLIEKKLGKKAKKALLPMQKGDVVQTCASILKAKKILGYTPKTSIEKGISNFINWYKEYYG